MDMDRTLLVVVDVQNGFVRDGRSDHVVPVVTDLVARWQAAGGATLFSRYYNYPGSPWERLIGWSRMQTEHEVALVDELKPYAVDAPVLDKPIYSIFTDGGQRILNQGGWTDLLLCGIATESCVSTTAVDAFERGLTPWVVSDAVASHAGDEVHRQGLMVLSRNIGKGQLITTADVPVPTLASA